MSFGEKVSKKFHVVLLLVFFVLLSGDFNVEASNRSWVDSNAESLVELKKELFDIKNNDSYNLTHVRELYDLDDTIIAHYYNCTLL